MHINVRFFIYCGNNEEWEVVECTESEFLNAEGVIEYERNTAFQNGVNQICLTKNPFI
jgi:hypothetical protein